MQVALTHAMSPTRRLRQAGFSYIGLLIFIVIMAGMAATALQLGATMHRRAAEEALLSVGEEYRRAITSYYNAAVSVPRYPKSLDDLLKDPRFPEPRRHLRKRYLDPITGKADWGLVAAPGGGIMGVHSLSEDAPIKVDNFPKGMELFKDAKRYHEWVFAHFEIKKP
jgi:type II secretory pathway pseudopilin PulG